MADNPNDLVRTLSGAFSLGDWATVATLFVPPVALYHEENLVLTVTLDQILDLLAANRERLRKRGVSRVEPHIDANEVTAHGTTRIWLTWSNLSETGEVMGTSPAVLYCTRAADGALQIQVMEFLGYAFPELLAQMPWMK
ncbi:MAG: hypothetical protein KGH84_14860 [Paracoccaceae bacterium]|nr:hypothetical protein [Paracoccaceae bacterium]